MYYCISGKKTRNNLTKSVMCAELDWREQTVYLQICLRNCLLESKQLFAEMCIGE